MRPPDLDYQHRGLHLPQVLILMPSPIASATHQSVGIDLLSVFRNHVLVECGNLL